MRSEQNTQQRDEFRSALKTGAMFAGLTLASLGAFAGKSHSPGISPESEAMETTHHNHDLSLASFLVGTAEAHSTTEDSSVSSGIDLPKRFEMNEGFMTWGTVIQIKSGDKILATNQQQKMSWGTQFDLKDAAGNLIATGKKEPISIGVKIDVVDTHGNRIGAIEEKLFHSLFGVTSEYSIKDGTGHEVATSKKTQLFTTHFELLDNDGRVCAVMDRGAINMFGDHWTVKMGEGKPIDSRVLLMIGAHKTHADNEKEHARKS